MLLIFRSLLIVLGISTALALIAYYAFSTTFIGVFLVATILQLIVSYFFNTWIDSKNSKALADREAELLAEFNRQGATVPCTYCGSDNFIPIRIDVPNDFKCGKCEEENAVYVSITAAQKTTPLDASSLEIISYNTQLAAARGKIIEDEDENEK